MTIVYQTYIAPSQVAQAEGPYENTNGWKINWSKFGSRAMQLR